MNLTQRCLFTYMYLVRPKAPILELVSKLFEGNFFKVDTVFRARCISGEASPATNISWYLDHEPLAESTSELERVRGESNGNLEFFTTKQEIYWRLSPNDNNRTLTCATPHITDLGRMPESTSFKLNVYCKPESLIERERESSQLRYYNLCLFLLFPISLSLL